MSEQKKFDDQYRGCRVLGNVMGLHEETVRKRVAAGLIPGKKTTKGWLFDHNDLVLRGIEPFKTHGLRGPIRSTIAAWPRDLPAELIKPQKINKTHVVFVLDGSASMSSLVPTVQSFLEQQLNQLKAAVTPVDKYEVSIVNFSDKARVSFHHELSKNVLLKTENLYNFSGGNTALNDAINLALDTFEATDDKEKAFLCIILTDGEENSSFRSEQEIDLRIRNVRSHGRTTITLAGPAGVSSYAHKIGLAPGNVTVWEQTVLGLENLTRKTVSSIANYSTSRSMGVTCATSFYAQPVIADAGSFAAKLDSEVPKITSQVTATRVVIGDPPKIRDFCNRKLGGFQRGNTYYELTKSEKVQDYKKVIIQDTDTGQFYSGWKAAKLVGLPDFTGTVRIRPGQLGKFKINIQSTSVNRKLNVGSVVLIYRG